MTSHNGSNGTAQQVGSTVLVVMMEVDKADDEVFNKWYNEEHVPERMAIPRIHQRPAVRVGSRR